jgi:hypothetical protein
MITPQTIFEMIPETHITQGSAIQIVRIIKMEGVTTYRIFSIFGICVEVSNVVGIYHVDPIWGNIDLETLNNVIKLTIDSSRATHNK